MYSGEIENILVLTSLPPSYHNVKAIFRKIFV